MNEILGDSQDPEDLFGLHLIRSHVALARHDLDTAFAEARTAAELSTQSPEVPLADMMAAAIFARDPDRIRAASALIDDLKLTGAWTRAQRAEGHGAVAAIDGRPADALAGFREAWSIFTRLGAAFEAASTAVNAATLLPDEPEVRGRAVDARPLLVEMRAAPLLGYLDAALADADTESAETAATTVGVTVEPA
jgi:hypothetical protein